MCEGKTETAEKGAEVMPDYGKIMCADRDVPLEVVAAELAKDAAIELDHICGDYFKIVIMINRNEIENQPGTITGSWRGKLAGKESENNGLQGLQGE